MTACVLAALLFALATPADSARAAFSVGDARLRGMVDPRFKSWNIDASVNRQWDTRDLSNRYTPYTWP